MTQSQYTIILFYNYTHITDPSQVMRDQRELCERLNLKGRTLIAHEGINSTLEGTGESIQQYWKEFTSDPRFADTHLKQSEGTGDAFPKLSIKVRPEIVSMHLGDNDFTPEEVTGNHVKPEELREWIKNGEDFEIVDMRSDYEYRIGKFKGSRVLGINNFREIPNSIDKIEDLKDKKVVAVCTGGVKCEKASGYLLRQGFKDVHQLDGGIVSYMEKFPNEDFEGKLFVFDNRMSMSFETDSPKHKIIANCDKCDAQDDTYYDCAYKHCPSLFICCDDCVDEDGSAYCSDTCRTRSKQLIEVLV